MMKLTIAGIEYQVSWDHNNNCGHPANATKKKKKVFVSSMTTCYITTTKEPYETYVGFYTHNSLEKPQMFDKEKGRTFSMKQALSKTGFNTDERYQFWEKYFDRINPQTIVLKGTEREAKVLERIAEHIYITGDRYNSQTTYVIGNTHYVLKPYPWWERALDFLLS